MATRRWSSKEIWMRSGCSLFLAGFLFQKPSSQKRGSIFFPLQDTDPTPFFGGFGIRRTDLSINATYS